jgi:predicted ATPase/DNA-binding winged helix-turn-helix (wHTH) protein
MADQLSEPGARTLSFDTFELIPEQRLLLDAGKPLRLGGRAFEILVVLIEHAGETVSKEALIASVWPKTVVEECNLRVHVGALRKALGQGQADNRYIENVAGRGYSFVAPLTRSLKDATEIKFEHSAGDTTKHSHNLPAPLTRMIGRDETLELLDTMLKSHRFVTVVGPGGMGKTTIALAVAHAAAGSFEHGARFADLASISDPAQLPGALATSLGITAHSGAHSANHSDNHVANLIDFLQDKRMLIVLDTCEHLIDAVALLTEDILQGAPQIRILATSREPLRAKGEWVYRLPPLASKTSSTRPTAAAALGCASVQLFYERACASLDSFHLTDESAPAIAQLCQKLDGLPLAIELAATSVERFGIQDLLTHLDDRLRLLSRGLRTAHPRHQTLPAMLEWSYATLSDHERTVFRRLAVFKGGFTLQSSGVVARCPRLTAMDIHQGVASLTEKSLLSADISRDTVYYRLLDTTRAYAFDKLRASGEHHAIQKQHAEHCLTYLQDTQCAWGTLPGQPWKPSPKWQETPEGWIDDVRAALDWAFWSSREPHLGMALMTAAAPLWSLLSLTDEYRVRLELALANLATRAQARSA